MLKIQFSKQSYKFLKRLPPKQTLQLKIKLQTLRTDPFPNDSKTLIGYPNYHRVSVGEYHIVYRVKKEILLISLIGKRNDGEVYKKLKRML